MSTYLENVNPPLNEVGTFSNDLGNGMTMQQLQQALQNLDLDDPVAIKQQTDCCRDCCSGNTVNIIATMPQQFLTGNRPLDGAKSQTITFEFKLPT